MASPKVFISSTYDDLKNIRSDVADFLTEISYTPILFEEGGIGFQTSENLDEDCYAAVSTCDYFVLIIGSRYGSPTSKSAKKKKYDSISKKEFLEALKEGIPIFVFVKEEVASSYTIFVENDFSTKIQYPNVDNIQVLSFLKYIYEEIGNTTYVFPFQSSVSINNILKQQFAAIVKNSSKRQKQKRKNTKQTRINTFRLWYEINGRKRIKAKKVASATEISGRRISQLTKMGGHENEALTLESFPTCSHEELSKLERFLECEGQLRIGQKKDFQHFYLAAYCRRYPKRMLNAYPSKYHRNGFRVKAVVFDFDGTMTPNELTTWEMIWMHLGYSRDLCGKYHRKFRTGDITHEEWCNITVDKFKQKGFSRETLQMLSSKILLRDDFTDVFERLYQEGMNMHIVSGSIEEIIRHTLKDCNHCFRSISANRMEFGSDNLISKIISTPYDFQNKAKYIVDRLVMAEKLHPLEILYIGNSSNDVWVSESGARTLCVDPKQTDPDEPSQWTDKIPDFESAKQILEHVYRGSRQI